MIITVYKSSNFKREFELFLYKISEKQKKAHNYHPFAL